MISPPLTRRNLGRWLTATAVAAVAPPVLARSGGQVQPGADRVTIAVGGQTALYYLPLALADHLGYFREEGLQVTVRNYPAGALASRAVQVGDADVCAGAFEHTLRQQALGHNHRAFVVQGRAPQMALGISPAKLPRYQGLRDLQGCKIGVSSLGSSTHLAACMLLEQAGVAVGEVGFVNVGSDMQAVQALRSGRIHALCHTDPMMTLLASKGELRIVGDLRSLRASQELFGGSMPASCLYAPQVFLNRNPGQAQALAYGIVHALKWLQTAAPADLVRALPADYLHGNRAVYLAAFARVRETYSPNGLMPEGGAVTALRALEKVQPDILRARLDLARTFTDDYARKARQRFYV